MREIRPSGSEGGETGQPVFPTPIDDRLEAYPTDSPGRQAGSLSQCASERTESARCKSSPEFGLNFVTESNCVSKRRGGKQLEVNEQSVRKKLDSACRRGEPAGNWRSLRCRTIPAHRVTKVADGQPWRKTD